MPLSEERKGQIALAAEKIGLKVNLQKNLALEDTVSINRIIENVIKEPEMKAIDASFEEILELTRSLLGEIFSEQTIENMKQPMA